MHDDSFEDDGAVVPESTALMPAREANIEAVRDSVADLAAVYAGQFSLSASPGGGLRATLRLPAA